METKIIIENQLNDYLNAQVNEDLQANRFFEITSLNQEIIIIKDQILINYNLFIPESLFEYPIMTLKVNGDYNSPQFGKVLSFNCEMCYASKYMCSHLIALINQINAHKFDNILYDDALIAEIKDKYNDYIQNQKSKMATIALTKLNNLVTDIKKTEKISMHQQLSLEPILRIDEPSKQIGIKIGVGKKFVVKDIEELLKAIKNKEVINYSKTFSTDHTIDSFDENSKKFINLLLLNGVSALTKDKKNLLITPAFYDEIFKIYVNSNITVVFNGKSLSYLVTEEKYDIKVQIKNNTLLFKDLDIEFLLIGEKYNYVGTNGIIKYIDEPSEVKKLQEFLLSEKKFDFSLIKEQFVQEIYSRFYDYIEVDDKFKEENPLKELDIEAYFDYQNDEIILNTKYYIDKQETTIDEVNNFANISKKAVKYQSIIGNIGFIDNKLSSIEKVSMFLKADLSELKKYAQIYLSNTLSKVQIKKFTKPVARLSYNLGMLDIAFDNLNYTEQELQAILSGIKKKSKYVKLKDNTIIELDTIASEQFEKTIEEFNLDSKKLKETQTKPLYQSLKIINDKDSLVRVETDAYLKNMINDIKNFKKSDYQVDDTLKEVMRDYQIEAYKWIKTLIKYNFSGIIADDMGLGKTLEMISVLKEDNSKYPSLIVCPKSLIYNWANEFKKWSPNDTEVAIDGISSNRKNLILSIPNDKKIIYITSYDSLRNDLALYKDKKFKYMILDEAQYIKNHNTLKAQSVKQINSIHRFVLTGTPIENSVMDLWSIFDFLMPLYLYNYNEFKSTYERNIIEKDSTTINNLIKKITPFVLRRTKEDVLKSLPDKVVQVYYAKMQDDQRKVYEAELLKTREILKTKKSKIDILASLTRLRQICVDPALYIEGYKGTSCKYELLKDLVNDFISNNHKVLIFSQFTSAFIYLEKMFKEMNISYYMLTGKTNASDRVSMASSFNEESKEKVFLCSLKAGGTGLNLVGADIVIHLDPWWNIAAENQATDRAHRIGQTNVVQVIKIICQDSIEQKVLELQEIKKDIANMLISSNDDNISKLSDKDLKYILS